MGDVATVSVDDARFRAVQMFAAIRRGENTSLQQDETLFEAVAETVFQRYQRVWKARPLYVNRGNLRKQILPYFAGRPIADIARQGRAPVALSEWFSDSSSGARTTSKSTTCARTSSGSPVGDSLRRRSGKPNGPACLFAVPFQPIGQRESQGNETG